MIAPGMPCVEPLRGNGAAKATAPAVARDALAGGNAPGHTAANGNPAVGCTHNDIGATHKGLTPSPHWPGALPPVKALRGTAPR